MFVKIPDNFTEQGLTLEHAYIYWRVARFNDGGLPYYESNKTLAEIMGKSEKTVKRYINELVKNGHLYRKTSTRKRILSIKPFDDGVHNEPLLEGQNDLLLEGQNDPYKNNKSIEKTSIMDKMTPNNGQNDPYERVKMTHYKDNRIDKLIEENQNTKSKDNTYSKTTVKDDIDELKELLSGKYPHDEDFC